MVSDLIVNFSLFTTVLFFLSRIFPQQMSSNNISSRRSRIFLGVILGGLGIVLTLFSIHINSEVLLDYRQLAIVTAAMLGGIVTSVLSSIIIGAFRLLYFGGFNESTKIAISLIMTIGISSGIIVRFIHHYWKRWIALILLLVVISVGGLYRVLGKESFEVIPYYVTIMILGSFFVAYLKQYLSQTNQLQLQLKENEKRYRKLNSLKEAIFQSATEVSIIVTDPNGLITLFNKGAEKMLGYTEDEMVGKQTPIKIHLDSEIVQREQELSAEFNKSVKGFDVFVEWSRQGVSEEREWTYVKKDGTTIIVNLIVSRLEYEGNLSGFIGIATNITEKKLAEEKLIEANRVLQKLSNIDGLTQIANRRAFDDRLEWEWNHALNDHASLALILFDIDFFKAYNDTYGHLGGDDCLKKVANVATQCVLRKTDFLARYGGEEFAVILSDTSMSEALQIAEKIRDAIEAEGIKHTGSQISDVVTISVGVACRVPRLSENYAEFISEADSALYHSKQSGRNKVSNFNKHE